jgi:Fe-S cluster assembly protein SufD
MVSELPQVIVRTKTRGNKNEEFNVTPEMVRGINGSDLIAQFRKSALDIYQSTPMPTIKDEAWRRTDIKSLKASEMTLVSADGSANKINPPKDLLKPLAGEKNVGQIILTAEGSKIKISEEILAKGVIFTDLKTAEKNYPDKLMKILGKTVKPDEGKFAAMAAALAQDGVFLYVPKGVQVELPFHSLVWGTGSKKIFITNILVYLEENSSVVYMHEAASPTEAEPSVHVGNVEIYVGQSANLKFVELQSWGEHIWNFSHERVIVDGDGKVDWVFGAIGSHLTKNFSDLNLVGIGAEGRISGFYFSDHQQHFDHDTQQNHLAAHTTSDLIFKGALMGESRSVWQGMIYVAPGAEKTDGYQANRNLILSHKARADSIPGLEILADDVRCTHGATVGKVDQEQLFYLLSRGIPEPEAERLIVEGFFEAIMQRIPFDGVRHRFEDAIHEKMDVNF